MARRVAVVGSGQSMHGGRRRDVNGQEIIGEAVRAALDNTGMTMHDIDCVLIGNMDHFEGINYVDAWSVEVTGGIMKPVIKLNTGGTTGTTVAIAAYHMVASGQFSKILAIGWEKNSESDTTAAITTAFDPVWDRMVFAGAIGALGAEAGLYLERTGATEEDGARVVVRDRGNALNNPHAHVQKAVTIADVMRSNKLSDPLKELDMCPRTDGAAAVIFADEYEAPKWNRRPAWVAGTENRHNASMLGDVDMGDMNSIEMASKALYAKAGIKDPLKELDVIEMYLPYSFAGLKWIEKIGLCGFGEAPRLLNDGVTDMGGELPINPSGGVISCNPIGATAMIRVAETALQVSGQAEARQVADVNLALTTGFGGCMWSDLMLFSSKMPG